MKNRIHYLARLAALLAFLVLTVSTQAADQCVQSPSGIIAWWPFDETSGNTAQDRVSNHTGAYANNPVPAEGKVGGSLRFNGANYVAVPDSDEWAFGSKDFTVELWANFDVPGGGSIGHPGDIFIGNDEGPGSVRKWFFALGGGNLNFHINSPSIGPRFFPLAPFSPAVGQWYHLAVTKSGTTYTLFINGTLAAKATDTNPVPNANAPLTIGQAEQIGFMNGRLDEVTIYNHAVTQAELQSIVNAGTSGKCKDIKIQPQAGGDIGTVSVRINGSGFADGATVKLKKTGEADIEGTSVSVLDDRSTLNATFDLKGKKQGVWEVVITNPDNTSFTVPQAFTVEEGRAPKIWVDIIGLSLIRPGRAQTFHVFYGNSGNVDGAAYISLRGIPKDADIKVDFGRVVDLSANQLKVGEEASVILDHDNERMIPVDIHNIPAGASGAISLEITLLTSNPFVLRPLVMAP